MISYELSKIISFSQNFRTLLRGTSNKSILNMIFLSYFTRIASWLSLGKQRDYDSFTSVTIYLFLKTKWKFVYENADKIDPKIDHFTLRFPLLSQPSRMCHGLLKFIVFNYSLHKIYRRGNLIVLFILIPGSWRSFTMKRLSKKCSVENDKVWPNLYVSMISFWRLQIYFI